MSFFGRKDDDPDDALLNESIDRAKREGRWLMDVKRAHNKVDQGRSAPDKPKGSAGPSCDAASSRQRGRRW